MGYYWKATYRKKRPFILLLSIYFSVVNVVLAQTSTEQDSFEMALQAIDYPQKVDSLIKGLLEVKNLSLKDKSNITLREIERLEALGDYPRRLANLYIIQSINYDRLKKRELSAPYTVKTKMLIEEHGDDSPEWNFLRGRLHQLVGYNYYWEIKKDKAIEEFEMALSYFKLAKDSVKIGDVLSGLGVFNSDNGDSHKALEYYDEAISILSKINRKSELLSAQFFKSVDLMVLDSLTEAKALLEELIPQMENLKHRNTLTAYSRLADVEYKLGNNALAEEKLKMVIEQSLPEKRWNTIGRACGTLTTLLEEQGRYKEALAYNRMEQMYADSLFEQKYNTKNIQAQAEYDALGKQQKISDLEQAQLLQS